MTYFNSILQEFAVLGIFESETTCFVKLNEDKGNEAPIV